MHTDLKWALKHINKTYHCWDHRGKSLTKSQVQSILEYGIKQGYETSDELTDKEVDEVLGWSADCESLENKYLKCRDILKKLLELKEYKDTNGKTESYLKEMPKVWQRAKDFIEETTIKKL